MDKFFPRLNHSAVSPSGTAVVQGDTAKFTDHNRLSTISIARSKIQITIVCIEFSDTGCGIDEDNMAKLFTPYFTTKPTGHGLGMTIIASIVRAHGGKIDVESKQGKGTKISVFIPRNERRIRMLEV